MKFLFATALLLLAVFGSTLKANRLIPKEKIGGTLKDNRRITKQVKKDLLLKKQEPAEATNYLNRFYEYDRFNNKDDLEESYLNTPNRSNGSTTSTEFSSSKKMNMKSPKKDDKTWNPHVKPMGLFDSNIHKEYIQPTNVINNKKALLEKLAKAKWEEDKKGAYMRNLFGNELDEEEIDYEAYSKLLENSLKMSDRAHFDETIFLDRVNDGKETSTKKQKKDPSDLEQYHSDIKKTIATYMSDQKQKEMDSNFCPILN